MKTQVIGFLGALVLSSVASAADVSVITNPNASGVRYSKVQIEFTDSGSSLRPNGIYVYHNPQVEYRPGRYDQFFVNQLNGTTFCRTLGHAARNTEGDGGSITCGEDESSYANFNYSTQSWEQDSTGSANRCYPLYKTIQCR